jgi:predicted nucleic acid-binding protein
MRIFLDANVLFAAGYVIEEARRNRVAKTPDRVDALERLLLRMKRVGAPRSDAALEASLPLPAKDRPVLATAIRQSCTALVTGDRKHFGALYGRTIHGVTIHSPRSLAEALLV